jgi:hypothetical protein
MYCITDVRELVEPYFRALSAPQWSGALGVCRGRICLNYDVATTPKIVMNYTSTTIIVALGTMGSNPACIIDMSSFLCVIRTHCCRSITVEEGSSVSIVTRPWAWPWRLDSRRGLPPRLHWLWGPPSCPMDTGGSFLGVKLPELETDHSPPSSAEVKNAWSYTSTHPLHLHGMVLS